MNRDTGEIREFAKLTDQQRADTKPDGKPLWVPMTRENLDLVANPDDQIRILAAIQKREMRELKRLSNARNST